MATKKTTPTPAAKKPAAPAKPAAKKPAAQAKPAAPAKTAAKKAPAPAKTAAKPAAKKSTAPAKPVAKASADSKKQPAPAKAPSSAKAPAKPTQAKPAAKTADKTTAAAKAPSKAAAATPASAKKQSQPKPAQTPAAPTKAAAKPAPEKKPAPKPAPAATEKKQEPKTTTTAEKKAAAALKDSERERIKKFKATVAQLRAEPGWKAFLAEQKRVLLEMRDNLLPNMQNVTRDHLRSGDSNVSSSSGQHIGDAGSEAEQRDITILRLDKDREQLFEIDAALQRIEQGTYGVCEISLDPIPRKRLQVRPFCRLTVKCQEEYEKKYGSFSNYRSKNSGDVGFSGLQTALVAAEQWAHKPEKKSATPENTRPTIEQKTVSVAAPAAAVNEPRQSLTSNTVVSAELPYEQNYSTASTTAPTLIPATQATPPITQEFAASALDPATTENSKGQPPVADKPIPAWWQISFEGRIGLKDFWKTYAIIFVIQLLCCLTIGLIIPAIISIYFTIVYLGLGVRRIHDSGNSGKWIWLTVLDLFGGLGSFILIILFYIRKSK